MSQLYLSLVSFDFRGSDLAAEEANYFGNHVRLAKTLAGLRLYLTGRLLPTALGAPERHRAALIAFDSAEAMKEAMAGETGALLYQDTRAHMTRLRSESAVVEVVIPLARERAKSRCLTSIVWSEPLADGSATQLPGLCGLYLGGGLSLRVFAFDRSAASVVAEAGRGARSLLLDGQSEL